MMTEARRLEGASELRTVRLESRPTLSRTHTSSSDGASSFLSAYDYSGV